MNIEYTKQGDYLIPNLIIPKGKKVNYGKYARLRLEYIKNHKKGFYTMLKMENKLDEHLADVDFVANWHINAITDYIAEQEGITEELKATHQMEWVGRMNNIRNRAEESVIKEIVYDGGADNE